MLTFRHLSGLFLMYSHLLESHHCLQVCWCSSGPGWRTRRRGPRGCPLLPRSPCNHQSHPWCWRRSWRWYHAGYLRARTSCQTHAAYHLPSGRVASPGKQIIFIVLVLRHLKQTSQDPMCHSCRCRLLAYNQAFLKTSEVFWKNEPALLSLYEGFEMKNEQTEQENPHV